MLKYSEMLLDRASNYRKDPTWLAKQKHQGSRWILVHSDRNYFCTPDSDSSNSPKLLSFTDVAGFDLDSALFLGLNDDNVPYFALDLTGYDESELTAILPPGEFVDLRQCAVSLDNQIASVLALARGLSFWHRSHRFCGRCGHENKSVQAGHARLCSNQDCNHQTFPRTDPAVIMIVKKVFADGVERCLLGRQANWPEGVFSCLAGFVDPGETLEAAVAREVQEESGVLVNNVQYIASQPWPFPSSIMLGFIADAITEEIQVDQDELDDANWFTREELRNFGEWGDEGEGFKVPRTDSISRHLIDHWLALDDK